MNAKVYEAVRERANGHCEQCGEMFDDSLDGRPELDHAFGRARSEEVATCWMLCGGCHRDKTANDPSASYWLVRFAIHCRNHGYWEAQEVVLKRLETLTVKEALSP